MKVRGLKTPILYFLFFLLIGSLQLREVYIDDCRDKEGHWECAPIVFNGLTISSEGILSWNEKYVGDIVSYLKMGKAWLGQLPMDVEMMWRFKNWPPLISLENALFLSLEKLITLGWAKLFVSSLLCAWLWSVLTLHLFKNVRPNSKSLLILLLFVPLVFPDFRHQLLGKGIFYSESQGILFYLLGLFYFIKLVKKFEKKAFFYVVLFWSLGANTRAQLDASVWTSVVALFLVCLLISSLQTLKSRQQVSSSVKVLFWLIVGLAMGAAPWKIRNIIKEKNYSMITTSGSVFELLWSPEDKLPYWMKHINTACLVRPALCSEINRSVTLSNEAKKYLALGVLLRNTEAWWKSRLKNWQRYLLPSSTLPDLKNHTYLSWGWQAADERFWAFLEGIFAFLGWLILSPFLLFWYLKSRPRQESFFEIGTWLFLWTGIHLGFFLLLPSEPRYFMFWRWTPWVALLTLFSYGSGVSIGEQNRV